MLVAFVLVSLLAADPATDSVPSPEVIYQDGLRGTWNDEGWAPRDVFTGSEARVVFANRGGWTIGGPTTTRTFGELSFRFSTPPGHIGALMVQLGHGDESGFPTVTLGSRHLQQLGNSWVEARVPYPELNPKGAPFSSLTLSAEPNATSGWVLINDIVLRGSIFRGPAPTGVAAAEKELVVVVAEEPKPVESTDVFGVSAQVGIFLPVGGGGPGLAAGAEARYWVLLRMIGLGLQTLLDYQFLSTNTADASGALIGVRYRASVLLELATLTVRLPVGPVAAFVRGGAGGGWLSASNTVLGVEHGGNALVWATYGALGAEVDAGPGCVALEVGYLLVPRTTFDEVVRDAGAGGLTFLLQYRFGA